MGAFEHEFHQLSAQWYAGSQLQQSQRQYVYGLGVEPEQQGSDKCAVHCLICLPQIYAIFEDVTRKMAGKRHRVEQDSGLYFISIKVLSS